MFQIQVICYFVTMSVGDISKQGAIIEKVGAAPPSQF